MIDSGKHKKTNIEGNMKAAPTMGKGEIVELWKVVRKKEDQKVKYRRRYQIKISKRKSY